MSLAFESPSSAIDEPSLTPALLDAIELTDTPVESLLGGEADLISQLGSKATSVVSRDPLLMPLPEQPASALVEDNLPPLIAAAVAADPLLMAFTGEESSESVAPITIELVEDRPFTVLLERLLVTDSPLESIDLMSGPDWLHPAIIEADSGISEKLVVQTHLTTLDGQSLLPSDLLSRSLGSQIIASIDVSDTRLSGEGLIGLQGLLEWNPNAATVLAIDLADTLPLFRQTGTSSDWDNGSARLIAAALPKAGAGEALGDSLEETFAHITLRLRNPSLDLGLRFQPELYPAVGLKTLESDQLLNLGIGSQALPLLQGRPAENFHGSLDLKLELGLESGERWQQPFILNVASRNDAPKVLQTLVELPAIDEDTSQPIGASVEDLFSDAFQDVDVGDQLAGVAITQISNAEAHGRWQFASPDQPWQTLDTALAITEARSFVLERSDRLRFLPDRNWSSAVAMPELQLRFIDSSMRFDTGQRIDARDPSSESALSQSTVRLRTRVNPVNDPPQAGQAAEPVFRGRQGEWFSASLPHDLFVDPDLATDPQEILTYSLQPPDEDRALPDWLLIDPESGRLSGVPTDVTPEPMSVLVIATDRRGASLARSVTLAIRPVDPNNTLPRAEPFQRIELLENEMLSLDLSTIFFDEDIDSGDSLEFTAEIPAGYAHWIQFDAQAGELLLHPGLNDVTPTLADPEVLLTATDRDGARATQRLSIAVLNANQAPQPVESANPRLLRVSQGGLLELDLHDWFTDSDLSYGDTLSFSLDLDPEAETAPWNQLGIDPLEWLQWLPDGSSISGRPDNAHVGTYDLNVSSTDLAGESAQQKLRIVVDNVNDLPVLTAEAKNLLNLVENQVLEIDLGKWFDDPDLIHGADLRLQFEALGQFPSWLHWDPAVGVLSGTPSETDLGLYEFRVTATSSLGVDAPDPERSISHRFRLLIERELSPVTLSADNSFSINLAGAIISPVPGEQVLYSLSVSDADGEPIPLGSVFSLKASSADNLERDDRLVIETVPYLVYLDEAGSELRRRLRAEEINGLEPNSLIDVEIQVEDRRRAVQSRGLLGADLLLGWDPSALELLVLEDQSPVVEISRSLSFSPNVDTGLIADGRLGISAASAPALGLGEAIGTGESGADLFARARMKLLRPDALFALQLSINDEEGGGLGYGLVQDLGEDNQLSVIGFSGGSLVDLALNPSLSDAGVYTISLSGTSIYGDRRQRDIKLQLNGPRLDLSKTFELVSGVAAEGNEYKRIDFSDEEVPLHAFRDVLGLFNEEAGSDGRQKLIAKDINALHKVLNVPADSYSSLVSQVSIKDGKYVASVAGEEVGLVPFEAPSLVLGSEVSDAIYESIGSQAFDLRDTPAPQGFKVLTIDLPSDLEVTALIKTAYRGDSGNISMPYYSSQINLEQMRSAAMADGLSSDEYLRNVERALSTFSLVNYVSSDAVGSINVLDADSTSQLLESLRDLRDHDGSALLIDVDGDGLNDMARLLILDNGFFDNDLRTGQIDDPLYFARVRGRDPQSPLASSSGWSVEASLPTRPLDPRPATPIPQDPSSPDSGSVDPEPSQPDVVPQDPSSPESGSVDPESSQPDAIPPDPVQPFDAPGTMALGGGSRGVVSGLRRSAGFMAAVLGTTAATKAARSPSPLRSALSSAFGGGTSQPADDRQSAASGSTVDLGVPSAQENPAPSPLVRSRRNPLVPLVQTLQRGFDALAEMDLVDYLALAAMVLPLTAQAGLQGGKQVKPFQLRLRKGNPATDAMQPLVVLVFGESLHDPLLQVWIEQTQGRVRILNSLPDGEEPNAAPQLVGSSKLWLWQRVCHTARPGELVASCRQALQTIEREGFEGSGLDRDAWLARTLDLHQSQRSAAAAFVSNLDFMVQLLGCLANLGYSYESVVR